jgi:hypothetical protein
MTSQLATPKTKTRIAAGFFHDYVCDVFMETLIKPVRPEP